MLRTNSHWPALLLGAALLTMSAGVPAAGMYKWTDSQGNVHYTQTPPPKGNYQQMTAPRAPTAPEPAEPQQGAAAPATPKPDQATASDAKRKELEAEVAKHNCEAARRNLNVYSTSNRVMNEKGEVEVLDDKAREAKIKEANKMIKQYCR